MSLDRTKMTEPRTRGDTTAGNKNPSRTAGTGLWSRLSGQENLNKNPKTGQLGQDSWDRTARTG
jgi:hypothetical protein